MAENVGILTHQQNNSAITVNRNDSTRIFGSLKVQYVEMTIHVWQIEESLFVVENDEQLILSSEHDDGCVGDVDSIMKARNEGDCVKDQP